MKQRDRENQIQLELQKIRTRLSRLRNLHPRGESLDAHVSKIEALMDRENELLEHLEWMGWGDEE